MLTVARVIRTLAGVLAALVVIGILFRVLEASRDNSIVTLVDDVAKALVGPFVGLFSLDDRKATVAVNWGIAAVVYLMVGAVLASLVARLGGLRRPGRARRREVEGD